MRFRVGMSIPDQAACCAAESLEWVSIWASNSANFCFFSSSLMAHILVRPLPVRRRMGFGFRGFGDDVFSVIPAGDLLFAAAATNLSSQRLRFGREGRAEVERPG